MPRSSTLTPKRGIRRNQRSAKGFALVIALSLMGMLVMILLSLSVLTKVEVESAASARELTRSQQTALTALNIALGNLQRETGPDQRVTASADLNAADLYGASVTNAHWVGVYGNKSNADYTQTPEQITASQPALLNWLVSGNETQNYDVTTAANEFGRIANEPNPSDFAYNPTMNVLPDSGSFASATPKTEFTINSKPARLMVGPGSIFGEANAEEVVAQENYVVAPLVDLANAEGSIDSRYAYWVGDEGSKSRINLMPAYEEMNGSEKIEYQQYAFVSAQRSGIETVSASTGNLIGTSYAPSDPNIRNMASLGDLPLLDANSAKLKEAAHLRFHDLTAYGHGVQADAYAGGLKRDLTADLAGASDRPLTTDFIFPPLKQSDSIPTWADLRSFAEPKADAIDPMLPSSGAPGINPVITFAALGMDFYLHPDQSIKLALYPIVVLWNPHDMTLNDHTFDIGFHMHDNGRIEVDVIKELNGSFETIDILDLYQGGWQSDSGSKDNFVKFKIRSGAMAPGESFIYCLAQSELDYTSGPHVIYRADPGLLNISNYVTWTTSALSNLSAQTMSQGRIRVRGDNPGDRNQSFDVVLAEENQLGDLYDSSSWYQAVLDTRPSRRGPVSGGKVLFLPDTWMSAMPPYSQGANNVYRNQMVMESRGSFSGNPALIGAMGTGRFRWLVTGNPRASSARNTQVENSDSDRGNTLYGSILQLYGQVDGGRDPLFPILGYTNGNRAGAGRGLETNANEYYPTVLFNSMTSTDDFLSLGQLQHGLTGKFGFYQTYPFANSWADVRIPRSETYLEDEFYEYYDLIDSQTLYDLSWHMNRALWDRYFLSTTPQDWTQNDIDNQTPLPNSRIAYVSDKAIAISDINQASGNSQAYDRSAANVWVKGAFNVNSTSENAWRALLSSTIDLPADATYASSDALFSEVVMTPRFNDDVSQGLNNALRVQTANNTQRLTYLGNRGLVLPVDGVPSAVDAVTAQRDAVIAELASQIVQEVKARGPFLSLADFVNRSLADDSRGIKGALQSAIDNMETQQVNPDSFANNNNNGAPLKSGDKPVASWNTEHYLGGEESGVQSSRFAGAPKFLTQADILSQIGPALSARSDTFRIRAYGETVNSLTDEVVGQAWCEAIVQRMPEYVDASDVAWLTPSDTTEQNQKFGRRYQIISFRWLSPSEI